MQISNDDPSVWQGDEKWASGRIDEALDIASRYPEIEVMIDTFCEVDRGYHPRVGLLDRYSNLTAIGQSLAGMRA